MIVPRTLRRILAALALVLLHAPRSAEAQLGRDAKMIGVGLAGDFAYSGQSDGALSLTAHSAFTGGFIAGTTTVEAGYRFARQEGLVRLSLETMFYVAGLHLGLVQTIDDRPATGTSIGAVAYLFSTDLKMPFSIGLFVGGHLYWYHTDRHPHELVTTLRILWDFRRSRHDTG